jgi:hypothetical protein
VSVSKSTITNQNWAHIHDEQIEFGEYSLPCGSEQEYLLVLVKLRSSPKCRKLARRRGGQFALFTKFCYSYKSRMTIAAHVAKCGMIREAGHKTLFEKPEGKRLFVRCRQGNEPSDFLNGGNFLIIRLVSEDKAPSMPSIDPPNQRTTQISTQYANTNAEF